VDAKVTPSVPVRELSREVFSGETVDFYRLGPGFFPTNVFRAALLGTLDQQRTEIESGWESISVTCSHLSLALKEKRLFVNKMTRLYVSLSANIKETLLL